MGKPSAPADTSGDEARADEEERKRIAAVERGNVESAFSAFTPEFFAGQRTDLEERFNPQIDRSFAEARGNLRSSLASQGLGKGSSIFQQQSGKLAREDAVLRENLGSSILDAVSRAETNVLGRKQNLLSTISAASDPAGAGAGAGALAQSLQTPVPLAFDLSGAFKSFQNTQNIADIIRATGRPAGGVQTFGGTSTAGKVVN